jgi:hypothetical protein
MMKTAWNVSLCISLLALPLLMSACVTTTPQLTSVKDNYNVRGNALKRGDGNFTLQGFQVPDAGERGAAKREMCPTLVRIAEVGGNTVAFDMPGWSADGKSISQEGLNTLNAYAERCFHQRMGVVVRLLAGLDDPKVRKKAIGTAARQVNEARVLYWVDGADAPELAARLKKKAPHLLVAAKAGGDIKIVTKAPKEAPKKPVLLLGAMPACLDMANVHFLQKDVPENYTALDQALMRPEEKQEYKLSDAVLCPDEKKDGFVPLFDGKSLDGWWVKDENPDAFHVSEDGFIEWRMEGGGALMTAKRYANFIFRCDWKLMPGGNSGIWFRAPRASRQSKIGFELQLRGDSALETFDKGNTGAIYDVIPPTERPARKEGLWNSIEVICNGGNVKVSINDVVVQDIDFDENEELTHRLRKGFICLTDHDCYVGFRNIRIKELP